MKIFSKYFALVLALAGMHATPAQAIFLTSDTLAGATVIDFSTQATVSNVSGPIQIGTSAGLDIQVNGDPNSGLYTNFNGFGLGSNGSWGSGMTYIVADHARPGSLIFQFLSGPVSGVGAFMNYAPNVGGDLIIRAFDSGLSLLEEYNVTALADISTLNAINGGAFRGIERATTDISFFEVSGFVPVVDDLTFSSGNAQVPEPGALALIGLGLLGLAWSRRKFT